jgi:hypothetical protein
MMLAIRAKRSARRKVVAHAKILPLTTFVIDQNQIRLMRNSSRWSISRPDGGAIKLLSRSFGDRQQW